MTTKTATATVQAQTQSEAKARSRFPAVRTAKKVKVKATSATPEAVRLEKRVMVPGGCRAYMRRTLAKEFEEIVQGFVEVAKTGSCPHVKLATELMKPIRKVTPGRTKKKGSAARMYETLLREKAEREAAKEREKAKELESADKDESLSGSM